MKLYSSCLNTLRHPSSLVILSYHLNVTISIHALSSMHDTQPDPARPFYLILREFSRFALRYGYLSADLTKVISSSAVCPSMALAWHFIQVICFKNTC